MARKKQFKYKKYFYRMKLYAGDTQETAGDRGPGDRGRF